MSKISEIKSPPDHLSAVINSVGDYLNTVSTWHADNKIKQENYLNGVWFRGNGRIYPHPLCPRVYRKKFRKRAIKLTNSPDDEEKRLHLERKMLTEFRISGAAFLNGRDMIEIYFMAQHYGMPTRLLDWTTNPLAGLFFAVENRQWRNKDGEVFIMEAKGILPDPMEEAKKLLPDPPGDKVLWHAESIRHPYVKDAIKQSFWHDSKRKPLIVPVVPDRQLGRIGHQSSCFTLHMHKSKPCNNEKLSRIKIPAGAKAELLKELDRLNVNQFTMYNDLDHLSKDIGRVWEIE